MWLVVVVGSIYTCDINVRISSNVLPKWVSAKTQFLIDAILTFSNTGLNESLYQ